MAIMVGGGLVLAALGAAMIGHSQGWGEDTAPPPAAAPSSEPEHGPDGAGNGKPAPAAPREQGEPDWNGLTRMDVHGAQLPVSPVHGPKNATEQAASGFTRDIGGAALAAVHLATRVSPQVGPKVYVPNAERMKGDRTAFLAQVDADYAKARDASGLPEGEPLRIHAQVIGYAAPAAASSAEQVTVHLLSRGAGPDGGEVLVSVPVTLTWSDGDWALRTPPGGKWPGQSVTGTAGYTLFPGED
ncbi:hypothetical protein DVA86_20375 [Streptomyces armeniacus]|uniref:DUF8175 domain-containing protein n=1 Tax=Streptomyces armeniacus TaxID=83291 RepID=A0A345XSN6_9ACTN|nr:hypothetical protein [Streptomyces armeniacus]AXK34652.1 hypothetical protein DVA86_20375 [Streptomyces armeniacus]